MNHLEFAAYESAQLDETNWERWVKAAETALGFDLDGDEIADGYSLDGAHDCFEWGWSVAEYVEHVREAMAEIDPWMAAFDADLREARFYADGRPANAEAMRVVGAA